MKIKWFGMSAYLITSESGIRVITDPFAADKNVLYPEIKEPADIVTVSCGHFSHCYVYAVKGTPFIYKGPGPLDILGINFNCITTRHLSMDENKRCGPGDNGVITLEIDGIKVCHLGALGYKLSEQQVAQIGAVDILLVPVGGQSTMPVETATRVCRQLKPKVILPMHFGSERCTFPGWATVDKFLEDKENVTRMDSNVGSCELEFNVDTLPLQTQIIVLRSVY